MEKYHERKSFSSSSGEEVGGASCGLPRARLSTAEKGNFLEVLNMSLNTFENHFLNRNLERTGQQSIVITPGMLSFLF